MVTAFKEVSNNAAGYLSAGIDDDDTSLGLESGQGSTFPAVGPFWVTLFGQDPGDGCEVIEVGGRSGDVLTGLTRGQQSTSPASWATGSAVQLLLTAQHLEDLHTAVNALEAFVDTDQAPAVMTTFEPAYTMTVTINEVQYRIALDPV